MIVPTPSSFGPGPSLVKSSFLRMPGEAVNTIKASLYFLFCCCVWDSTCCQPCSKRYTYRAYYREEKAIDFSSVNYVLKVLGEA